MITNKILILPETNGDYYEDEAEKLPPSGIVVDSTTLVRPGERVWFSYTSEKWKEFYLCDPDDIFVVERGNLVALNNWELIKWDERERFGKFGDHDDLLTKKSGNKYYGTNGRKLCVSHDHEDQEWYWIIDKSVPYLEI